MHQTAELKTEITRMLAVFAPHHLNNVGGGQSLNIIRLYGFDLCQAALKQFDAL